MDFGAIWLVSEVAVVLILAVGAALVVFLLVTRPKRCPHCGRPMQLKAEGGASHKRYRCKACGKTVKTDIPVGRR